MKDLSLRPEYTAKRALVIGINDYQHASPLGYAVNDAEAVAKVLREKFDFPEANISILLNEEADRDAIRETFFSYVTGSQPDDQILVFFAGHGYTHTGRRGEVGFLVPSNGNLDNLSTLIRWDELTRNAELIPAKHILFIMDACYGGLAITRSPLPGSARFLKEMLLRPARQVLTAGKADEVVADSGGPLPNHSVFTGHFLQALEGKAATEHGLITANGVMSYTYQHVAMDQHSQQTPHYGFVDGDGDFIFSAPDINELAKDKEKDTDVLIAVPSAGKDTAIEGARNIVELTQEYLSDPKYKIRLHGLVVQTVREVLLNSSQDHFKVAETHWNPDEFVKRLEKYEKTTDDLESILICLGYWGENYHDAILRMAMTRITDRLEKEAGLVVWNALRWYPVIRILYSAGIAAVSSKRWDNLAAILLTKVRSPRSSGKATELVLAVGQAIVELERADAFKSLPGHERNYVPRSEYLFKILQPKLDDVLFLGQDYESVFDTFEVLLALVHAYLYEDVGLHIWAPVGRFGWKYKSLGDSANPLRNVISEAENQKDQWPLLSILFENNFEKFSRTAGEYERMIKGLPWY